MTNHIEKVMHITFPQIFGAGVSVGTGVYSVIGAALPVVQFLAACIAIVAGALSIASVIRHWKDR